MRHEKKLSDRENEIIKLICDGLSDGEIATHLSLRTSTIRTHRSNILEKLNLSKTVLLVRYAVDHKII